MLTTRAALAAVVLVVWPAGSKARVYKTQKQILSEVFLGGYEPKTAFLTEDQVRVIEKQSRSRLESKIITYYVGRDLDGREAGLAFFDNHTVRTSSEVVFVWIEPGGQVARTEILAFFEPEDYKVRQSWLDRLDGKRWDDELTVGRDLDGVTGATLTVRALAACVRRSLALSQLLSGDD